MKISRDYSKKAKSKEFNSKLRVQGKELRDLGEEKTKVDEK